MGCDAMMAVVLPAPADAATVRRWAYEMARTFGHGNEIGHGPERPALAIASTLDTHYSAGIDAPPERIVVVNIMTRHYGPGYERGPGHTHLLLAEWLARRTGGVPVYGDDSSGKWRPCDAEWREETWSCLMDTAPYWACGTGDDSSGPVCAFCGVGRPATGWSGDATRYTCHGCGSEVARLAGREYAPPAGRDTDDTWWTSARLHERSRSDE